MVIQDLQPFTISFIIGLLIGIERERSRPIELQVIGVRTFIFIALMGTLIAWLNQTAITIILASFIFGIILLHYLRLTKQQGNKPIGIGTTTELAAGVVFCLGYMTLKAPYLSAILGVLTLLILLGRKNLREFSRNQITNKEIRAAVTILLLSFFILPFLPNHSVDPWMVFNPQQFMVVMILIAIMQFSGYVAVRVFGNQFGMLFAGFFGGLVSSTAIFVMLSKIYHDHPAMLRSTIAAALSAIVAMLLKILAIVLVISPLFFVIIIKPLLIMMMTAIIISLLCMRGKSTEYSSPLILNPLDFKSVLKLTIFIFGMLVFIAVVNHYWGTEWGKIAAFLGGLFEIHSVTLAVSTLFAHFKIDLLGAEWMLISALLASFLSKAIILGVLAKNRFGIITTACMCLIVLAGGMIFIIQ